MKAKLSKLSTIDAVDFSIPRILLNAQEQHLVIDQMTFEI